MFRSCNEYLTISFPVCIGFWCWNMCVAERWQGAFGLLVQLRNQCDRAFWHPTCHCLFVCVASRSWMTVAVTVTLLRSTRRYCVLDKYLLKDSSTCFLSLFATWALLYGSGIHAVSRWALLFVIHLCFSISFESCVLAQASASYRSFYKSFLFCDGTDIAFTCNDDEHARWE